MASPSRNGIRLTTNSTRRIVAPRKRRTVLPPSGRRRHQRNGQPVGPSCPRRPQVLVNRRFGRPASFRCPVGPAAPDRRNGQPVGSRCPLGPRVLANRLESAVPNRLEEAVPGPQNGQQAGPSSRSGPKGPRAPPERQVFFKSRSRKTRARPPPRLHCRRQRRLATEQ